MSFIDLNILSLFFLLSLITHVSNAEKNRIPIEHVIPDRCLYVSVLTYLLYLQRYSNIEHSIRTCIFFVLSDSEVFLSRSY